MNDKTLIFPEQDAARPSGEIDPPPGVGDARFADAPAKSDTDNRGRRAGMTKAGEVVGSGAGAGGGGAPEEHDSDPMAGGGTPELPAGNRPEAEHENSNT